MTRHIRSLFCAGFLLVLGGQMLAQTAPPAKRNLVELARADLSGAPNMEVITSRGEWKTGESIPRHLHHGIETGFVLQGAMVQEPGKEPMMLATGSPLMNLRDVPHAGFKVVGEASLILLTVHIVDKGKPVTEFLN
jgi:hypothetical protein